MSGFCGSTHQRIPVTSPSGNWNLENLIGGKVKVKSVSIWNGLFSGGLDSKTEYTIEEVKFRISIDGKCFTVLKLKELPDRLFTLKDVEILSVVCKKD